MTVLRCTAKLLKRLKQPAKPPEPAPEANPLGEWYADIEVWRRQPFVVLLNAATGALLVLPGNAANLRVLHERALLQFAAIAEHHGLRGPGVDAELHGFDAGFAFAATRDRSLLSSLNQRKFAFWLALEHGDRSLPEVAAQEWDGLFKHAALGRNARHNMEYHRPLDLLRQHLLPAAQMLPFDRAAPPASH
ncbi:hypothetical protein AB7849_08380 [Rhodanobacter sp. 115]|uniref:DUF6933 domain-containing protein n=1 Tax=Rhodanobacter sp. FW021-MT20 TaxID=1162282 RepID=UPI000260F09C|nr:hypothetical protein [Rhodanobacter sp. 115]EIL94383.1 hypothetical protein UU5_12058 [Rhodanobacter sp. 115]